MVKLRAHTHNYDIVEGRLQAACTVCGFVVPLHALTSRVNLDAIVARRHATPRLRERLQQAMGASEPKARS